MDNNLDELLKDVHEIKLALIGNEFNNFQGVVSDIKKISVRLEELEGYNYKVDTYIAKTDILEKDVVDLKKTKTHTDLYFKIIVFVWSIITGVVLTYLINRLLTQ